MIKQSRADFGAAMFSDLELFLNGSANRAGLCTVTATDAGISVDNVNAVTLGDALYGTISCTSTASDAIFSNLKCHGYVPPFF